MPTTKETLITLKESLVKNINLLEKNGSSENESPEYVQGLIDGLKQSVNTIDLALMLS
jgi:hypothetical protein